MQKLCPVYIEDTGRNHNFDKKIVLLSENFLKERWEKAIEKKRKLLKFSI